MTEQGKPLDLDARLDMANVFGGELSRQITRVAHEYGELSQALYTIAARVTEIGTRPTGIADVITASRLAQDVALTVARSAAHASLAPIIKAAADYDSNVPAQAIAKIPTTVVPPAKPASARHEESLTEPDYLLLGDLIGVLKTHDPEKRVKVGFRNPHSYRGYYEHLAFEIAENVTVGEMLGAAQSALDTTFQGWKGGDYTMDEHAEVWLVAEEGRTGETLGAVLLHLMLTNPVEGE